jgi:predicted RecA/RadA family phage recombinase
MATNFVQSGKIVALAAPYDRTSGQLALFGRLVGVSLGTVLSGATGDFHFGGVWTAAKTGAVSGQALAVGDNVYFNTSSKVLDADPTVGPLAGVAMAAALTAATTCVVRLNGVAPAILEGPQAAIVALTDSTGGSGTHDDTLADGLTAVALTGTLTGTTNGAMVDIAATAGACAGGATPTASNVDTAIATAVATIVSGTNEQLKELQTMVNTCITDLTVQNQNDSDLAQKILEIRTALIAAGILASA